MSTQLGNGGSYLKNISLGLAELTYKINHHSSHILFFLSRINLPLVDEKLEYAFILVKDLSCIAF